MASLADIEQFLEQLFERSTARLFRTRVQAVQLERRVERAMERARSGHGARTSVPARYRVRLHPDDMVDVAPEVADAQALAARLADAALAFARAHAYHLPGRPSVALVADPSLARGQVEVDAGPGPAGPSTPMHGALSPAVPPIAATEPPVADPAAPIAGAVPLPPPVSSPPTGQAIPFDAPVELEPGPGGIRGDGTQTLVFRRPAPAAARAALRVSAHDGRERLVEVTGSPLTMGRARDNVLVLDDPRVSRHHGRLQARRGTLVYTDLGSTNGSRVNGVRVDEIALGLGDRLEVGGTVLVVESLPG
jgi:FhaA, N-terminal domain/FHA domain